MPTKCGKKLKRISLKLKVKTFSFALKTSRTLPSSSSPSEPQFYAKFTLRTSVICVTVRPIIMTSTTVTTILSSHIASIKP